MPAPVAFDPPTLELLTRTREAEIETSAVPGAGTRRTTVWVVVVDGQPYLRSYVGARARWYREALADPEVVLHAAGQAVPVRVVHAPDAASVAACSRGFMTKYAGDRSTPAMVRESVLETTLRLEPR